MIFFGDSRKLVKTIDDRSINCCVTSPPYFDLRDYSDNKSEIGKEKTPDDYVSNLLDVFVPLKDKLADDGTFFLNVADKYNKNKGIIPTSWTLAMELIKSGWILRQCIIWHKPNPKPESVKDRFTNAHEYVFFFVKQKKYYFDWEANATDVDPSKWGIPKNKVYNGGSKKEYGKQQAETPGDIKKRIIAKYVEKLRRGEKIMKNARNVWTISTPSSRNKHCAVYPEELVKRCLSAGCKPGGKVLDPFHGEGTTEKVANSFGFMYQGFDLVDWTK